MIDLEELHNKILERGVLEIAIPNIQSMDHEEYALVRKNSFGGSDSSILCGVNLYKTMDQLIKEKNIKALTKEEKEVGEKPIVKKGYDLEPIILDKAAAELPGVLFKPDHMYRFKDVDGLTINYDGVLVKGDILIPVEAKLVSKYGEKYYNKLITEEQAKLVDVKTIAGDLAMHIKNKATKLGIPAYYYTQVQQEMAGLNAPYGYLAAMFDETWSFKIFYIPRDEYVINKIYNICENQIKNIKRDTD